MSDDSDFCGRQFFVSTSAVVIDINEVGSIHRRRSRDDLRPISIGDVDVESRARCKSPVSVKTVFAIWGHQVQVEIRVVGVPRKYNFESRRRDCLVRFVKLDGVLFVS